MAPYSRFRALWKDKPDLSTPVNAAAMQHIEGGVLEADTVAREHAAQTGSFHGLTNGAVLKDITAPYTTDERVRVAATPLILYWDPESRTYTPRPDDLPEGLAIYWSRLDPTAYPPEDALEGDEWKPARYAAAGAFSWTLVGTAWVIPPGPPDAPPPDPTPFPVAGPGGIGYEPARVAAWTNDSEWTRMAATSYGNVGRTYASIPATIDTTSATAQTTLAARVADTVWCRVQAILAQADPSGPSAAARIAAVEAYLDAWATAAPVFQVNTQNQTQRLNAGWMLSNLLRAASLIEYSNPDLDAWLVDYCWNIDNVAQSGPTLLDWPSNGNWHAIFAEVQLAIAVQVGDVDLWARARAYYRTRLAQSIYHPSYDETAIAPLKNDAGSISSANTVNHWGGSNKNPTPQVSSPYFIANFPTGTNCERTRDHGHVCMAYTSWINGAFTILAQGETLNADEAARLDAGLNYHATRVVTYFTDGTFLPAPWPLGNNTAGDNTPSLSGLGGNNASSCWYAGKELLPLIGGTVSADLTAICAQDEVISYSPAGANHQGSDRYAFGA